MKPRTLLGLAVLVVSTASLSAQQQPTKPQQPPAAPHTAIPTPIELYKLEQLTGLAVKDATSAKVAKLEDFVLNAKDGTIAYVVVATGGSAGTALKKHVLPWRDLQITTVKKDGKGELEARVKLGKTEVEALKEFDAKTVEAEKTVMACAGSLKGHKVLGESDKGLAEVGDVVLDVVGARVNYVVLSTGGFLDLGAKHYAVPWAKLMLARESNGDLKIDCKLNKASLEKAPAFDGDHWEKMREIQWVHGVYTHFGCEPYWPRVPAPPAG